MDEDALLRKVRDLGRAISSEHAGAHQAADALQAYLAQMHWRCAKKDVGVNRYARVPELALARTVVLGPRRFDKIR